MNSTEGHERSYAMCPDELKEQVQQLEISRVDYRPIIRAYLQRLGVVEVINRLIPTEMEVQPGVIVAGMIQDTVSGRSPLYRLEEFFKTQDTEPLLGSGVEPGTLRDHNVGRVMDRIYEAGPSRIFSEVSRQAAGIFDLDTRHGHWDTTSVSVWGDYDLYRNEDDPRLRITFGHSKDHRPDLKQFLISMLCVEHTIPILGDCHDGNSADKTLTNKLLTRISKDLANHGLREGAFTYVADSAFVNEENLAYFNENGSQSPLYFVTRLPFTYKETDRVLKEERKRRMTEVYSCTKITFYCEADAIAQLERLKALPSLCYQVDGQVHEVPVYARGRPPKSGPRKVAQRQWQIKAMILEKPGALAKKREEAGCFVLLTNRPKEGPDTQSAEDILRTYKAQEGIERNYSFLRDPLIVNDLFLKKPERIEALGMVLLISLLIWNLMQRSMRRYIEKTQGTLEGWDGKRTDRPTSFMMTTKFQGLMVVKIAHTRVLNQDLTQIQKQCLLALGVNEKVFIDPRPG
jgi:transposase